MKALIIQVCVLLAKYASSLPDFSHLVPGTHPLNPEEDEEFKFGPFFEMFTGIPPSPAPAPITPPTSLPRPTTQPPIAAPTPTSGTPEDTNDPASTTRTAFYQYQWSGVSNACRFGAPRTILKCLGGGVLLLHEIRNADCEELSLDIVKCSQVDLESDSIVEFQCIGNTDLRLTAEVRTLPSEATDCSASSGTAKATASATLGRFCKDPSTGVVGIAHSYPCIEGEADVIDGTSFCSSVGQCNGTDCAAFVSPISIKAFDKRQECSTPETHQNLTDFIFKPSSLASYNVLLWTFSDQGLLCDWDVPDIEISCRNGGIPKLEKELPFCHKPSGIEVIVCTNPDPNTENGRDNVEMEILCLGKTVEQLVLDVKTLDVDTSDFTCESGGILVQGLDIARGCGRRGSDSFTLFKSQNFCVDPEQFHQDLCFAGFSCPDDGEICTDVSFDAVLVDTSDKAVASCIYAEQP